MTPTKATAFLPVCNCLLPTQIAIKDSLIIIPMRRKMEDDHDKGVGTDQQCRSFVDQNNDNADKDEAPRIITQLTHQHIGAEHSAARMDWMA